MQRRALYLVFIAGTALPYLIGADNTAPLGTYTPSQRQHWAFVKRSRPQAPQFSLAADRNWVKNPVDAFILARLKKEGLRPARPADRATLIRRVYFDLIGLPPAPGEVARFIADKSPDSYPKLVERLLASPQYGERWGRHWLDGFGVFYEEPPRGLIFLAASRAASATRRCGSCLSFSNSRRAACAVGPISPNAIAAWRRTAHSGS